MFEHLADPDGAARELHRVVRPGGLIAIQIAFLQPLHADPGHYFNATEAGVRRWFRGFDIQSVTVPTNLNPLYAMSWMCSDLLYHTPEGLAGRLSKFTVGQLAEVWKRQLGSGSTWETFMALPEHAQRPLAAGFQLLARRPTS